MINSLRGAIFTGETCFYDTGNSRTMHSIARQKCGLTAQINR